MDCINCSIKMQKAGKHSTKLGLTQKYKCLKCGSIVLGEFINKPDPNKHIARLKQKSEDDKKIRLNALKLISNNKLECENCGCNDLRILEINHKDGNGKDDRNRAFCLNIVKGLRSIEDLNILCKACNIIHYINLKYGINYKIKYVKA